MTTQITPAELADRTREIAIQAKEASKELARTLGALEHACGQLILHQSAATENWYQRCHANTVKANQRYRELINQLL